MKERPILFSAPMVRALLDGSKTQTRRLVKPQPRSDQIMPRDWSMVMRKNPNAIYGDGLGWNALDEHGNNHEFRCPYGQPGDQLWVRESIGYDAEWGHKWADGKYLCEVFGDAYSEDDLLSDRGIPSIHVPRRYSRITLEVTGVRVERLHDISDEDARLEGTMLYERGRAGPGAEDSAVDYQQGYRWLWESINGPGSWGANPFVWVISFVRVAS